MRKLIAFFTLMCLMVGTTSAKGILMNLGNTVFSKVENAVDKKTENPEGSYAKIDTKKLEYSIPYIPAENR